MPKLSELTKQLKEFALNPAISDEEFLNGFLLPFVNAGNIKNKNHEEFHLNKSRTSEIMNQKADVPVKLREALAFYTIREKTIDNMGIYVEDYLDPSRQMLLLEKLTAIAHKDCISIETNVETGANKKIILILLTDLLLKAISESNLTDENTTLIWNRGVNSIDVQSGDLFCFGFDNRHKKKNIVVIPVNTAFDTHVTRKFEGITYPLVSENTIHGQWLLRLKASGEKIDCIDERITESLNRLGFHPAKESQSENGIVSAKKIVVYNRSKGSI